MHQQLKEDVPHKSVKTVSVVCAYQAHLGSFPCKAEVVLAVGREVHDMGVSTGVLTHMRMCDDRRS